MIFKALISVPHPHPIINSSFIHSSIRTFYSMANKRKRGGRSSSRISPKAIIQLREYTSTSPAGSSQIEIESNKRRRSSVCSASGSNASSTVSTSSVSSTTSSYFAKKTVLESIEEYSDSVVVKEIEEKKSECITLDDELVQKLISCREEKHKNAFSEIQLQQLVFFDLETGGLVPSKYDILEIAAVSQKRNFGAYIKPQRPINPQASRVNKITFKGGILKYRGKEVPSMTIQEGLRSFLDWLESLRIKIGMKPVLVAHNSKFDSKFIMHYLVREHLEKEFLGIVEGFLDTLPIFRKNNPRMPSHKQSILVEKFLPHNSYDAHSARSDVEYLQKLFLQEIAPVVTDFSEFSYTSLHALERELMGSKVTLNMRSYDQLLKKKVLSSQTATKLCSLDYRYDHLVAQYRAKGVEGLRLIFTELDEGGKPRITSSEIVLSKIERYFKRTYK